MTWLEHGELAVRLLAGAVLGAVVGYERDKRHHPAGLRTHALVGLASSTFMVVSTHFLFFQGYTNEQIASSDTSKIASAVVAGIGFLAGGAILRHGFNVEGLTTAAGLWLVSALGLTVGAGMYVEGLVATLIGESVMIAVGQFESKSMHRRLAVTLEKDGPSIEELLDLLTSMQARPVRREYERDDLGRRHLIIDLWMKTGADLEKTRAALELRPGISRIRIEDS